MCCNYLLSSLWRFKYTEVNKNNVFLKNESPTLKLKKGQFNKDQEQPPEVFYKKSCF